ncbi:hypothetical protein ACLOJK_016034 [Asimina triloba]
MGGLGLGLRPAIRSRASAFDEWGPFCPAAVTDTASIRFSPASSANIHASPFQSALSSYDSILSLYLGFV